MGLVITLYNNDGSIAKRTKGPSQRELKRAHETGKCHWLCSYCDYEMTQEVLAKSNVAVTSEKPE